MKRNLLLLFLFIITQNLTAQKDTVNLAVRQAQRQFLKEAASVNINIYPVPVRADSFTIKTDKNISAVKITNMIGQEIYRAQYKNPMQQTKVLLENPKRGIYLVTIVFSDGIRIVKKIMVEESE